MTTGEVLNRTAEGEGGSGPISKLRKNKRWSLGPERSMYEVGTLPPHNSDKSHGLVASINNNISVTDLHAIYIIIKVM